MGGFKKIKSNNTTAVGLSAKKQYTFSGTELENNGILSVLVSNIFPPKNEDYVSGLAAAAYATPSVTPTITPTVSIQPTITPTPTFTPTPTITPTPSPQCVLEVQGVLVVDTDEPEEPEYPVGVNTVFIHIPNE